MADLHTPSNPAIGPSPTACGPRACEPRQPIRPTSGRPRCASLALALLPLLLVSGCALVDDTVANALASRAQASATVGGRLLKGQAYYTQGRVGQVHLESEDAPALACSGSLTLIGSVQGVAQMRCSNGQSVDVPFALLSPLRATGRGRMGDAEFFFSYGLPPEQAGPFLGVPAERLRPPPES